jgi:hypothetical protein
MQKLAFVLLDEKGNTFRDRILKLLGYYLEVEKSCFRQIYVPEILTLRFPEPDPQFVWNLT